MKLVRILHVVGAMNRGGAEVLLMDLYRNLDRNRVQFDFIVYDQNEGLFDKEINSLGGNIFRFKNRFYRNPLGYLNELYSFFLIHPEYECVHSHLNDMSGYILLMAKLAHKKVRIAHSHSAFPTIDRIRALVWWIGRKLILSNANYILGCSSDAIVYCSGFIPDGQKRIVMKNAINIKKFAFDLDRRNLVRERMEIPDSNLVLGNVARFNEEKNHFFILEIFKKVLELNKNSLLILVGSGPLQSGILKNAKEMNIESNIKFLGVRSDVNEIINAFDVFLMPSLYEGLGIVLVEAQANGIPCIVSDTIPKEADINAGLINFLALKDDVKKWSEAVLKANRILNTQDPQFAAKEAGYDIHEVASWLQKFYLEKTNS